MMIKFDLSRSDSGQGLIEAMLAVAMVLSLVYALLNLGSMAYRSASYASDRVVANRLMQEGLEILRARRDEAGGWNDLFSIPTGAVRCFTLEGVPRGDCYDETYSFQEDLLLGGSPLRAPAFERTFTVDQVWRAESENCPAGCNACGDIVTQSTAGSVLDNCSRKVTIQVAWPGVTTACQDGSVLGEPVQGNKYCVRTISILTNWKR